MSKRLWKKQKEGKGLLKPGSKLKIMCVCVCVCVVKAGEGMYDTSLHIVIHVGLARTVYMHRI
jgi:hypothetical protein